MKPGLRIVMAQLDFLVGDIPGNTAKVIGKGCPQQPAERQAGKDKDQHAPGAYRQGFQTVLLFRTHLSAGQ